MPVWIRMWRETRVLFLKILGHEGHLNWPLSREIGTIIWNNIWNFKFIYFAKKCSFTMLPIEMFFQIFSFSWCIITLSASIGLFSSMYMYLDVKRYLPFLFHNFATQRTLWLTICKNDWLNNLQKYFKFYIYLLS